MDNLHFEVFFKYKEMFLKGIGMTILLSVITIITSTVLSVIVGVVRTMGRSKLEDKNLKGKIVLWTKKTLYWLSTIYVEVIRGVPLLVQILFAYFALPMVLTSVVQWFGIDYEVNISNFAAAIMALTICYAAYGAEIVRAGIESVDNGQIEASRSLGMNSLKTLVEIILPQAIKRIIPPLTSQYAALIKDTSLVFAISVQELAFVSNSVRATSYRAMEVLMGTAVLYFIMTFAVSMISKYFERKGGQR